MTLKKSRYGLMLLGACCLMSFPVFSSGINDMFNKLGVAANMTDPGGFQDQAAGYYTGGGLIVRQKSRGITPLAISPPKVGGSCGELDLYGGGFSYFKAQEMVELVRRFGKGVPVYALQLALKSMVPQVEGLLNNLSSKLQGINKLLLDECMMKQALLEGLAPKQSAFHEKVCEDVNLRGGNADDFFGTRRRCEKPSTRETSINKAREKNKDLLVGEYNLVWHVLKKMPLYANNHELAEFIMSVVGTIISKKEGDEYSFKLISPKADSKEFLETYLHGGKSIDHLSCSQTDKDKCLSPLVKNIKIEEATSMKVKTVTRINRLRDKYINFETLTDEEQSFLSDSVAVPLYKYIQVSAAAGTPFIMNEVGEFIGLSVLLRQFELISEEILTALEVLEGIQLDKTLVETFKKRLQLARERLHLMLGASNHQSIYRLTKMIRAHEQVIIFNSL